MGQPGRPTWPPQTKLSLILDIEIFEMQLVFTKIMTRKPKIGSLINMTKLYPFLVSKKWYVLFKGILLSHDLLVETISWYKFHLINKRNEPCYRKRNAKIRDYRHVSEQLAKDLQNGRHLKNLKIREKRMAVSPPKPYCHTNKREMYGSQSTQALLSYK